MIMRSLFYFMLLLTIAYSRHPKKVKCVNIECTEPISKGVIILNYVAADEGMMSAIINEDVIVFSKSLDKSEEKLLWGVQIGDRKGYLPSRHIKEMKILNKPKIEVDVSTESVLGLKPDQVLQQHEVVDGTVIYHDEASTEPGSSSEQTSPQINIKEEISDSQKDQSVLNIEPSSSMHIPENVEDFPNPLLGKPNGIISVVSSLSSDVGNVHEKENQNEDKETKPKFEINDFGSLTSLESQMNSESINPNKENDISNNNNELNIQDIIEVNKLNEPQTAKGISYDEVRNNISESNYVNPNSLPAIEQPLESNTNNDFQIDKEASNDVLNKKKLQNQPSVEQPQESETPNNPQINIEISNDNVNNLNVLKDINLSSEETIGPPQESHTDKDPQISIDIHNNLNILNNIIPNTLETQEQPQKIHSIKEGQISENAPLEPAEIPIINIDNNRQNFDSLPQNEPDIEGQLTDPTFENISNIDTPHTPQTVSEMPEYLEKSVIDSTMKSDKSLEDNPNPTEYSSESDSKAGEPVGNKSIFTLVEGSNLINDQVPLTAKDETPTEVDESENSFEANNNLNSKYTFMQPEPEEKNTVFIQEDSTMHSAETNNDELNIENSGKEELSSKEQEDHEPENESSDDSVLSQLYSTVSNIWASTEKPEPLHATSEENAEHFETNTETLKEETFSFTKYIMDYYNTIFFSGVDTKDILLSTGGMCFEHEQCDIPSPPSHTGRLLAFLGVTALTTLLFTLGYYYIDNKRQDGRLVGMVNSLQRDLLCTTKECEILKDELHSAKEKLAAIEDSSFGSDEMVQSLKLEIEELRLKNNKLRLSLDDNEKLLRVSESATLELQTSLGDMENTMSELLMERNNTDEQIAELNEKVEAFEEELTLVTGERDSIKLKLVTLEKDLEQKNQLMAELQANLEEVSSISDLRECELKALKEIMKKMDDTKDLTELIDASKLRANLMQVTQERDNLKTDFEAEHYSRVSLANDLGSTKVELEKTEEQYRATTTRLEVLENYFREREAELLKELSTKESIWLSKQGESMSTVDKIEALQKEVQQYKEMCESTRRELSESNAARRTAETESERRAHEAWLEAQRAKREAQAYKDEAATLRRQLNAQAPSPIKFDALPPLLPPPLPRPPPLGRLPSPLSNRFNDAYSPERGIYSPPPREFSPHRRRSSPYRRDYSPGRRNSSPSRRVYSPDRRDPSPERSRRSPYSSHSRRSRERYYSGGRTAGETETDYSPPRRYSRQSGPSSASGASSESND